MHRHHGEALRPGARIALVSNDALGNFAAATPLLQMLRSTHEPSVLHYFGGARIHELAVRSDLVDRAFPLHGTPPLFAMRWISAGPYDLVVNIEQTAWSKAFAALLAGETGAVCGPCVGEGGRGDLPFPDDHAGAIWADKEWIAEDVTARHPSLQSGFIGEILCRACYLKGPIPRYRIPSEPPGIPVADVLIATAASLPEKLWPAESWIACADYLRGVGLSVGLIGAKPSDQGRYWHGADAEAAILASGLVRDLRGQFTLPQVVGALGAARLVLSLDNGILHFAVASETPTVGLFRHGIHRLWAPPFPGLTVLVPQAGEPVGSIEAGRVVAALAEALDG